MTWQDVLKANYTSPEILSKHIGLPVTQSPFHLNVPKRLVDKIEKGNLEDPLYKQFVATSSEKEQSPDFIQDPVCDADFATTTKLLRKYKGRALLLTTGACAMHCRYCFRQNYAYDKQKGFAKEFEAIANDRSLFEVILSGGDPLSLPDRHIDHLLGELDKIPHIQFVRFHTRFPIGIPERITKEFLALFENRRIKPVFIIHSNHARELDADVEIALKQLPGPVYNQAVLLRGVNDTYQALKELAIRLTECNVHFYYLHQLDKVSGTMHFEVAIQTGLDLIAKMRTTLPGYMVPKYVTEIAGKASKTPVYSFSNTPTE